MAKSKKTIVTEEDFNRAMSVFNDPDNQQYFSDDVQELIRKISGLGEDGISKAEVDEFLAAAKQLKVASRNFAGDIKGSAADVLAFAEEKASGITNLHSENKKRIVDLETRVAFAEREAQNAKLSQEEAEKKLSEAEAAALAAQGYDFYARNDAYKNYLYEREKAKHDKATENYRQLKEEAEQNKAEAEKAKKSSKTASKVAVAAAGLGLAGIIAATIGAGVADKNAQNIQYELNDQRAAHTIYVDESNKTIEDLMTEIAAKDLDNSIQKGEIEKLNDQIDTASARIKTLQERIETMPEYEEEWRAKIAEKEAEIAELNARKTALEQQNAETEEQIDSLEEQLEALENEKVALQNEKASLEGENETLSKENEELRAKLDAYENPTTDKTQAVADLSESTDSNEATVVKNGVTFTYVNGEPTQATIEGDNGETITAEIVNGKVSSEDIADKMSSVVGSEISDEDESVKNLADAVNETIEELEAEQNGLSGQQPQTETTAPRVKDRTRF